MSVLSINVARQPFRYGDLHFPVGSIIDDPTGLRLFKNYVKDGKIAVVDEHNLDHVVYYIANRYGIDVRAKLENLLGLVNVVGTTVPGGAEAGAGTPESELPVVDEPIINEHEHE